MSNLFELYRDAMLKTLDLHPHIGMCNFGKLKSTKHAIDIFQSAVQLGLEGIVIVRGTSEYFKLKQKMKEEEQPQRGHMQQQKTHRD
jgi:hypothetical protein